MDKIEYGNFAMGLRTQIRGKVYASAIPTQYTTNYGVYYTGIPDAVVEATCEEDVVVTLKACRSRGIPVVVRGAGHSSNGVLNVARGGVLLVNAAPASPSVLIGEGIADIEARARWDQVERRLNAQGATTCVLPNTLTMSVGGTISVGGYGPRSIRRGAQIDNIDSLRLILPDGTPIEANPRENAELFRFALAGVGSVGVIERVRIRTFPTPAYSRSFTSVVPTWQRLVEALEMIAALPTGTPTSDQPMELAASCEAEGHGLLQQRFYFDSFEAAAQAKAPEFYGVFHSDNGGPERAASFSDASAVGQWLSGFSRHRKVWADFILDGAGLKKFVGLIEQRRREKTPGYEHLPRLYLLMIRVPSAESLGDGISAVSPLSPSKGDAKTFRFGCGLYHLVPEGSSSSADTTIAACEALTDLCIALGGRPYVHGVATMSEGTRLRTYGDDYIRLQALRQSLDPNGLFNAGWFGAAASSSQTIVADTTRQN